MQKKILLVIIICTVASAVDAQIKKGAIFLGGQLGLSTQSSKNDIPNSESKSTGFNISPAFGKAIKENLVIGGDISFGYNKNESSNTQKTYSYGVGFFVRQYKNLAKDFYLFVQSRLGASYSKSTARDNGQPLNNIDNKGFIVQAAIYPGIAYGVSKKIQLEGGLNNLAYIQYNHSNQTSSNSSFKTNAFSLGSSLSNFAGLTVGFRVLLN